MTTALHLIKIMAMLSICIFFFIILSGMVLCAPTLENLPLPAPGPESFAFDLKGCGPYITIADGRIVKYEGSTVGFVDFAFTSPNRTKAFCDGTNSTALGPICGRPLGLGFYYRTGELYVVDAFFGLVVVGPKGGLATQLASSADGQPFHLADGIEVDQVTGDLYFTDSSGVYGIGQIDELISTGDSTGRLLKYNRRTKQVKVLLSGLAGPAGVALSTDRSFLLITEFIRARVQKYWLRGPKANTLKIILNLTGSPNKIKRTMLGDFWMAVTEQTPSHALTGQRITGDGVVLKTLTFSPEFNASLITEVQEFNGALYLGSLFGGYVGVYRASKSH